MDSMQQVSGAWSLIRLLQPGDRFDGWPLPGGVALLELCRPDIGNDVGRGFLAELEEAVDACAADAAIRVLVVAGAPSGSFATGPAAAETVSMDVMDATAYALRGQEVITRLAAMPKPVIAAIEGRCLDGGLELALACDVRVTSLEAVFGLGWSARGLIPAFGGAQRLARLVGPGQAKELLFGGEHVDAREAHRIGLVERVTPAGGQVPEALAIASRWAAQSPKALAAVKETVSRGGDLPLEDALRFEAAAFGRLFERKA